MLIQISLIIDAHAQQKTLYVQKLHNIHAKANKNLQCYVNTVL